MKPFAAMLATAMLVAGSPPASAEPYTLMIFETNGELAKRTDPGEAGKVYWASYGAFAAEAQKAGILRGGSALYANDGNVAGVTVESGTAVRQQAFDAALDMRLSGFFQIDVPDEASAIAWAAKIPAASTGRIEIRAGYPAPAMQ